jgi:SPP1 family predicted phage head-tail adaptor
MRERVSFEREQRTPNGQGGYSMTWSRVAAGIPARIEGQSGNEAITASVERSVTRWRVQIRDHHNVTAKDRLIWKGQKLAVVSAMPDPRNRGIQLLICESGLSL